jgi:hypothetical protein
MNYLPGLASNCDLPNLSLLDIYLGEEFLSHMVIPHLTS